MKKKTITEIAKEVGVDRSTVSKVLSGTYQGTEATKIKVMSAVGGTNPHGETENTETGDIARFKSKGQEVILSILNFTRTDKKLSLIFGESGVGKTWSAKEFKAKHDDVYYYKAMRSESVGGMLSSICEMMELSEYGTISKKINRISRALQGKMLIVDEADLLVGDDKLFLRKLDIFREFYEAGTAVALIGLPTLYQGISAANQTYVYSRVSYTRQVDAPSENELITFAELNGLQQENAMFAIERSVKHGWFRCIKTLAEHSVKFDGDVRAASTLMFVGGRI